MWPRKIIIRLFLPIIWRIFPSRIALALHKFSITEIDSAWQSLYAMKSVEDPKIRAKLFQHALEEFHHGALFADLTRSYSDHPLSGVVPERTTLFDKEKKEKALLDFYAFECVGERNVRDEFGSYAAASPYADITDIFEYASQDEKGHALYTDQMLTMLTNSKTWAKQWQITRVTAIRLWEAWLRFGRLLGQYPSGVLLVALYFIFGPFLSGLSRRKIAESNLDPKYILQNSWAAEEASL